METMLRSWNLTKRVGAALFIMLFFVSALPAQNIAARLNTLLNDALLEDGDVSLAVYDTDADSLLFAHRSKKLVRPASVLKLVTSTVALNRLGCDYTIDTRLFRCDNASGGSNLYIQGVIDPLFSEADLMRMLAAVPSGLRVDTLFADCTFMDSVYWGPGWSWDDTPWEFQPYISPLMLDGGCVTVKAVPAGKGEPPVVECSPQSSFYRIENEAVSGGQSGGKFTILRDWLDCSNVIRLRGDCNAVKSEKMNMYRSQDFFIAVMLERLADRGVTVGCTGFSATPADATELFVTRRPIAHVVYEALMESNNLCAEALSYHLGALYGWRPVRQNMGTKIMKGYLDYYLDAPQQYNIADGSGLSLYSYISADILLQVLLHAHDNAPVREIIVQSLPQAGISGTLKNRMKGTAAYKKIFAKTGTVKGVCTLAGYAQAANGHTLAFVILNSGSLSARAVRGWQDRVCDILCR